MTYQCNGRTSPLKVDLEFFPMILNMHGQGISLITNHQLVLFMYRYCIIHIVLITYMHE